MAASPGSRHAAASRVVRSRDTRSGSKRRGSIPRGMVTMREGSVPKVRRMCSAMKSEIAMVRSPPTMMRPYQCLNGVPVS